MGLNKGPFVVSDTVSVTNAYGGAGTIQLVNNGDSAIVATVDVCVKQPQKTQVSLDSMAQIAVVESMDAASPVTFEVTYEIMRNGTTIATINDEMDYEGVNNGRHTNFPNFPIVDSNPSAGINTYDLVCTRVATFNVDDDLFVASRSLKATVFTSVITV